MRYESVEELQSRVSLLSDAELMGQRDRLTREALRVEAVVAVGAHEGEGWQRLELDMIRVELIARGSNQRR